MGRKFVQQNVQHEPQKSGMYNTCTTQKRQQKETKGNKNKVAEKRINSGFPAFFGFS
jgi:hypothetical protein